MADGWGYIRGYRRAQQLAKDKWVAVRGYWATHAKAAAVSQSLIGQRYHDRGIGKYAPTCVRVDIQENMRGFANKALLLAHYETLRPTTEGKLIIRRRSSDTRTREDLQNHVIQGPDADTGWEWEVVRGSPYTIRAGATYILQTACWVSRIGWDIARLAASRRGKINRNHMRNFPGTSPYTLLYLGIETDNTVMVDRVYVDHVFLYNGRGWNNDLQVQKGVRKTKQYPVLDAEDQPVLNDQGNVVTRPVRVFAPAQEVASTRTDYVTTYGDPVTTYTYKDAKPESRMLYQTADFGDLDKMVVW